MMRFAMCGVALAMLVACGENKGAEEAVQEATPEAAAVQPEETASATPAPRPAQEDSYCQDYVSAAMIKEYCGPDVTIEAGFTRGDRCERKVIVDDMVLFTASFNRARPESWDKDQRNFPSEPVFEAHKKGEGGRLRFSVYPHLVALSSNNPSPPCNEQELRALGTAIAAAMPAAEPAPATVAIAGCDELLPAQEVEKACGKAIAVKSSGMADGDLNICNHSADGLIFLLTRHRDPAMAQRAAGVAADGASVADSTVHMFERDSGPRAVVPVRNLLVELKSSGGLRTPNPPCTADQLETLAEGVVERLQ